jgi:UPF0755 protein
VIARLLLLALLCALGGLLAWRESEARLERPLALPADGYSLIVAPGETLRSVAERLSDAGVMPHPELVILYARWRGTDQLIKRGEYLLLPGLTPLSLLELLRSGKVVQYQVTLPEGITLAQALAILARQQHLEITLEGADDPRITALTAPYGHPEGLFFPDSYFYDRGTSDWQILQRAHDKMMTTLEQEWQGRAEGLPYETPYDALIMASIIERETGLAQERGEIAGVFVRRLQKGMRLQTDPTVIYGAGSDYKGNLRRSHLNDESNIYNTYRHHGLPPSPIALPGREAIHAALHPLEGNTLFFVARGDGGHVFSATLAEHQAAVRQYQLKRKKDYRSSPGPQ